MTSVRDEVPPGNEPDVTYGVMADYLLENYTLAQVDEVRHDFPYVMKAMDVYRAEGDWHNTAFEILISGMLTPEDFPEMAKAASMARLAGVDLPTILMNLLNLAFATGHILGEGSEHIHKCNCRDDKTDGGTRN